MAKHLAEGQRQEVFLALVTAQDQGVGVVKSRKGVAETFGLTDRQVRQIEAEGLEAGWPPLG